MSRKLSRVNVNSLYDYRDIGKDTRCNNGLSRAIFTHRLCDYAVDPQILGNRDKIKKVVPSDLRGEL